MKHAFEVGSGVNMHILSFIKIYSEILNLKGRYTAKQTFRRDGDCMSLPYFQNKDSRLKSMVKL
jgi:hypothetical protein